MYSPPSSPVSIGGVLDDGIRLFRESFGRCWLLAVIPGLVAIVFTMSIGVPSLSGASGVAALMALGNSRALIAYDILAFVVQLTVEGAVLVQQIAIVRGDESVGFGGALGKGLRRLPGTVLGSLILFVIFIACFIPIGITVGYSLAQRSMPSLGAVAIDIAVLLLAVWLWGRLQLWLVALFGEDASATGALGSSWRLTQGHWWRVSAIFTVAVIMILVIAFVFSFIGGAVAGVVHMTLRGRLLLLQAFGLVSNAIYYPLLGAIWLAIYQDLKLRREGGDLASRAGALSGAA